jgi:predicted 3-demethylubiquinone-9 3-methyltransferase (glyoxalase superfamily)
MNNTIYPCLWFNGEAKEAAEFYCSVFKDSAITAENHMVVTFESSGHKFMCLNGGPQFTFNPSVSFFVLYETKEELGKTWNSLLKGGSVLMPLDKYAWSAKYGWLQDRFGVRWQLYMGRMKDVGQKFATSFLFSGEQNGKAEQAIQFYTSTFEGSGISGILKYGNGEDEVKGNVKHAQFNLGKNVFMATDSSLPHKSSFNEAISLVVECKTQAEIDFYWDKLTDGGEEGQCGWLKDKFGVSWQIVPSILGELMSDPSKSGRVINAFLQMKKFDIEKLVNA